MEAYEVREADTSNPPSISELQLPLTNISSGENVENRNESSCDSFISGTSLAMRLLGKMLYFKFCGRKRQIDQEQGFELDNVNSSAATDDRWIFLCMPQKELLNVTWYTLREIEVNFREDPSLLRRIEMEYRNCRGRRHYFSLKYIGGLSLVKVLSPMPGI